MKNIILLSITALVLVASTLGTTSTVSAQSITQRQQ